MPTEKKTLAWRRAIELANRIYRVTAKFPAAEKSGLAASMRRTAVTIPTKIADAQVCSDPTEHRQAIRGALFSIIELQTYLTIAQQLGHISRIKVWRLERQIQQVENIVALLLESLDNQVRTSSINNRPTRNVA